MKEQRYKLYCSKDISRAKDEEFSYIPKSIAYVLIYTNKDILSRDGYFDVKEEILLKNKEAHGWLMSCKNTINSRYLLNNKEDVVEYFNNFLDRFENELKAIRQR